MFLSLCLFGLAAVGLWKTLRRRLLANTTINLDIPLLGQPRTTKISGTAVVCGGRYVASGLPLRIPDDD